VFDGMIVRAGTSDDLPELIALNSLCFPSGTDNGELADLSELESAAEAGSILLCVNEQCILGFLQYELPVEHHLYISTLAVHPDYRRLGIAARLLDLIIDADTTRERSVSVVTAPDNYPMLRLLFSRKFVVRMVTDDYLGRFYCQYQSRLARIGSYERFLVPAHAWDRVLKLLQGENYAITGVVSLRVGPAFEISRLERDNLAALRANESSSGVAFSGGILAAITFLLGFSFTSPNYPDSVRIVLIGAAFASTLALIIYANAAGDLVRLYSNNFNRHMEWGNVLSEFGGVLPLLITLPVVFAQVAANSWAPIATSAACSVALFLYVYSPYSIFPRFDTGIVATIFRTLICLTPLTGVLVLEFSPVAWPWTAATCLVLITHSLLLVVGLQKK
jgi:ribosomal protein S18 acetylase RimI-like enzyme